MKEKKTKGKNLTLILKKTKHSRPPPPFAFDFSTPAATPKTAAPRLETFFPTQPVDYPSLTSPHYLTAGQNLFSRPQHHLSQRRPSSLSLPFRVSSISPAQAATTHTASSSSPIPSFHKPKETPLSAPKASPPGHLLPPSVSINAGLHQATQQNSLISTDQRTGRAVLHRLRPTVSFFGRTAPSTPSASSAVHTRPQIHHQPAAPPDLPPGAE